MVRRYAVTWGGEAYRSLISGIDDDNELRSYHAISIGMVLRNKEGIGIHTAYKELGDSNPMGSNPGRVKPMTYDLILVTS